MTRLLPVLLATLAVTACGFSPDAAPRPVELDEISVVTSVPDDDIAGQTTDMWFVDGSALVPIEASVADLAPATVLGALIGGGAAVPSGLRSAIPPATALLGVALDGGVAIVDLSSAFTLVGGDEEIRAVGQVVLTLTSLDGITGVRFFIDGNPVAVPVGEGELVDRALTADDFSGRIGS